MATKKNGNGKTATKTSKPAAKPSKPAAKREAPVPPVPRPTLEKIAKAKGTVTYDGKKVTVVSVSNCDAAVGFRVRVKDGNGSKFVSPLSITAGRAA